MGTTKNSALFLIFFWMLFCFFPAISRAVVAVQSEVVSGTVEKILNSSY